MEKHDSRKMKLELIKSFMPAIVVLVGAVAGYVLVDRHAQNVNERAQMLSETEFEAQNVFRILEKYLEQQPYPELARFQMLGFISETTHNDQLRAWAERQRNESVASVERLQVLAQKISIEDLELKAREYDAKKRLTEQKIKLEEEKAARIDELRLRQTILRQELGDKRSELAEKEADEKSAYFKHASAEVSVLRAQETFDSTLTANGEQNARRELEMATRRLEQLDIVLSEARQSSSMAQVEVAQIEQDLTYVESDLDRIETK